MATSRFDLLVQIKFEIQLHLDHFRRGRCALNFGYLGEFARVIIVKYRTIYTKRNKKGLILEVTFKLERIILKIHILVIIILPIRMRSMKLLKKRVNSLIDIIL